jgi:phosphatidylglycerophosphatase A
MNLRFIKEKNPVNEEHKVSLPVKIIASGLFSGYIPIASGTFGSFVGMLVYLIPGFSHFPVLGIAVVVGFAAGVYMSNSMSKRYGDDPPEVVIDEIVGLWFSYVVGYGIFGIFLKAKTYHPEMNFITKSLFAVVGFIIFRVFDIIKLQPAKYFDDVRSGYGIMMDDIVSGFYSGILSAVLTHFLWYRLIIQIIQ